MDFPARPPRRDLQSISAFVYSAVEIIVMRRTACPGLIRVSGYGAGQAEQVEASHASTSPLPCPALHCTEYDGRPDLPGFSQSDIVTMGPPCVLTLFSQKPIERYRSDAERVAYPRLAGAAGERFGLPPPPACTPGPRLHVSVLGRASAGLD